MPPRPRQQQPTPPNTTTPSSGASAITPSQQAGSGMVTMTQEAFDVLMNTLGQIGTQQDTSSQTNPPPRWATDPRYAPSTDAFAPFPGGARLGQQAPGTRELVPGARPANTDMYQGDGLVVSSGRVLTRLNPETGQQETYKYDPRQDGFNAYVTASPEEREMFADTLRDKGFKIETYQDYVDAYSFLFSEANDAGLSFDRAYKEFKRYAPDVKPKAKAAPTYRITSAADIKAVAKEVAYKTLGRNFNEAEADQFVKTYQQMEVSAQQRAARGGVVEAQPDIGVAAEQFAQKTAPGEAGATRYFGHVNAFMSSLRGL